MDDQKVLIAYWTALGKADGKAMAKCYAKHATFRDPVFRLEGKDIGAMWKSLMDGQGDLVVETGPLVIEDSIATGTWKATYTFSPTGRKVVNHVRSMIEADGGKIVHQRDDFPFWKWSRMALGASGLLLGWTPLVRRKVRRVAAKRIKPSK